MKRLGFTFLAAAVLGLPLTAQQASFRVDVPFEFSIGTATVPAGNYVVSFLAGPVVQLAAGNERYFFQTNPDGFAVNSQAKLIFDCYGDQYFLAQIQTRSATRDLPESRVERELRQRSLAGQPIRKDILLAMR